MNKWYFLLAIVVFAQCNNNNDKSLAPNKAVVDSTHIKDLEKKISQKPDSVGLRFDYITALDSMGDYRKAISQIDSLIINDKGNYGLWFKKAQICEHSGDTNAAINYYNTAISIYPAQQGLLALANLYAETKNIKTLGVCRQLDEMRLGREYDAYTAFFAGVYFSRTGNKQKALDLFDRSIDNNYTFMDAYMEKGYVYYDTKKYDKALEVFALANEVNNRFADAYYWQGKCYEALNKKTEAIAKYQLAYNINNSLIEAQAAIKRLQ
jgi:tetratricopeptide (TPR) repeat protein